MSRRRAGSRAVAVATLAGLLLASLAPALEAQETQGRDIEALWKARLKRPPPPPPSSPDNPLTPAKVALGAKLFADPRLSGSGQRSCATCHQPRAGFHGRAPTRAGAVGRFHAAQHACAVEPGLGQAFLLGRARALSGSASANADRGGPGDGRQLGGRSCSRLGEDADLVAQFRTAFPEEPQVVQPNVLKALAAYVGSLVSPPTRFDAWVDGDAQALRPAEERGFRLFIGKAGCILCHVGWRFTDDRFHDVGLRGGDEGRGAVPGGTPGLMAFKTPSLREAANTAPYMHDGSLATLEAVVGHYAGGFLRRPSLATNMNRDLRLERSGEGGPRRLPAHAVEREGPRPRQASRAPLTSKTCRRTARAQPDFISNLAISSASNW